jgi:hypothetical protein
MLMLLISCMLKLTRVQLHRSGNPLMYVVLYKTNANIFFSNSNFSDDDNWN